MVTKILGSIYYLLADKYAFTKHTSLIDRFIQTSRYKSASKGVFLSDNERKLASFKNIHEGKRCFIIGNGPSLNSLDLTKLKNEFTFGVNAIYLNYDKMNFHPSYYVVEDNLVAEDRRDEISSYKGPNAKFFGNFLRYCIEPDDQTIFVNLIRNYAEKDFMPYFSEDFVRKVGVGGSVTFVCLQLAFFMGFSDVYMIGFDHNYSIPDSAKISNKTNHSFDILSTEDDVNHFSKEYFGKGYRWHDPNVERMELGFISARKAFEKANRRIFNATKGGHLDVFPRVDFDSIF